MLDVLSFILTPIIFVMGAVFSFYEQVLGSAGVALMLLAATFAIVLMPLQNIGRRVECRVRDKMRVVEDELAPYKTKLKGEALFNQTEEIYKKHNYHPIHSVGLGMSFIVLLPVLISAILLIDSHPLLEGRRFLFVPDLSQPDRLLGPVNLLPVIMTLITVSDAFIRFRKDRSVLVRFLITAAVLFALVYNLAAGLVIYWTTNVFIALLVTLWSARSNRQGIRR